MSAATDDKLRELLDDFSAAMLVTRRPDGALRSRPMAVAGLDGLGGGALRADLASMQHETMDVRIFRT